MRYEKLLIAIPTYNNFVCIKEILNTLGPSLPSFNSSILICDSSTDDDTFKYVKENKGRFEGVEYLRLPSNMHTDEKVFHIFENYGLQFDYTWLMADRFLPQLDEACSLISLCSEFDIDIINFDNRNYFKLPDKLYFDCNEFFVECFWDITRYGSSIVSKKVVPSITDRELFNKYKGLGFSYQLQIMEHCAINDFIAIHLNTQCITQLPFRLGIKGWAQNTLKQWITNLNASLSKLPNVYSEESKRSARLKLYEAGQFFTLPNMLRMRAAGAFSHDEVVNAKCEIEASCDASYAQFYFISLIPEKSLLWIQIIISIVRNYRTMKYILQRGA